MSVKGVNIGILRFDTGNYKPLVAMFFVLLAAVLSSGLISGVSDIGNMAMILFSVAIIIATFADTNIGLIAILLSMLLSPELEVGATPGRAVVIRAEDLLLIIVSVTWLAKMAIRKELPVMRKSPLNAPIGLYCAVLIISTVKGIITGDVSMLKGMFYVFKLIEYFVLFFIVLNHTSTVKQVKLFLIVLLLTSFIVALYCNLHLGSAERMSAPFEGEGEPNTLGGYLLFIMSLIGGLILYYRPRRKLLSGLLLFVSPAFMFTLSRASYLGVVPALFTFIKVSRKKIAVYAAALIIGGFALMVLTGPPRLRERVVGAFQPEETQRVRGVGPISLGPSPAARVESWRYILEDKFPKRPILGYGVTGTAFLDSQYILALAETGIIGLCLFLWIMWRIWKTALANLKQLEKPLFKGIVVGYLAGFAGLLFHAIGSNTFIIIRIAEPFWFFTAIVVKLVDIETGKAQMEDKVPRYARYRI